MHAGDAFYESVELVAREAIVIRELVSLMLGVLLGIVRMLHNTLT